MVDRASKKSFLTRTAAQSEELSQPFVLFLDDDDDESDTSQGLYGTDALSSYFSY